MIFSDAAGPLSWFAELSVSGRSWSEQMAREMSNGYPRALTEDEHDLIEALLGGARSGAVRFVGQLEGAEVVGGCRCGCPSIDLSISDKPIDGRPRPLVLADGESPEGVPVGVILWVCDRVLSGLEVHPWDGSNVVRLPRPETLCNIRAGRD